MKSTEEMSGETARELFGMVFDEDGVAVPPDDLAPGAMAGYRRFRRRRTALAGAGASAALVGVACVALLVAAGGTGQPGTAPGVRSSAETTVTPMGPETGPTTGPTTGPAIGPTTSSLESSGSRAVDCFSNFVADGDRAKAQADCRRAESLWQAVFAGLAVRGARNPSFAQIRAGFVARVEVRNAAAPSLYGHVQPQVVQDWTDARQENADVGSQSWSGFDISTGQGTIIVSADYRSGANSSTHLQCLGVSPCESVPLGDGSVAEVSSTGDARGYLVTVRAPSGDAYRISFTSDFDPSYVDVPCSAPGGHCYANLTDGSIRPGAIPASDPVIDAPVVTQPVLTEILKRPAFAALVQGYFAGKLGQPGS
ncbi:hypothetical protein ABH935_006567 [Catenulispora sp. GAS73]|uniref:hypothetical protein n=1 Tax=Catenulispora sp. GAS73 TaxID=3156269 RepID=UPI003511468E